LNDELASLESDTITHPEYLAMVAAITRQREERASLARIRFQFQVKNLQNRCAAERAQFHSQYAQTVRDLRDSSLARANQEWYQIQRGRRAVEDSIDRTSLSTFKRTDLIAQQNAYNTEVSILSGVAKYVGFPSAPEVTGASQSEMEEDLRAVGVSLHMEFGES
jgi:hypothetical protein